jgi:ketosteroid isomerase-like protein
MNQRLGDQRELLLAAVDGASRGDTSRIAELAHPDMVFHPMRAAMTGDYYGPAGMVKFMADNAETFDHFEFHFDEIEQIDENLLYAAGTARVRGKGSQVDTTVITAGIVTFKDGLVIGWHDYGDRAAARAAAGL